MRLRHGIAGLIALAWISAWGQEQPSAPPTTEQSPPADSQAPPADSQAQPPTAGTVPVNTEPAPANPKKDEATSLDTIEVTAQRRKERLQDVPVAVTAITQDQVEARRISRLDDLNSLAPGLQVSRSPSNTTISQITIRASSQINPAIYWDPAVGVYLDGVYIGKGQGAIFDIVDLAGVEVLRGPQGTLYGRNTIAGTINFITREPTGNFNGNAAVEYGSFNNQVLRASLDLPHLTIADITLGVRSERRDGWVKCVAATCMVDALNNRHGDGAHLGALLDLTHKVTAQYHLDWTDVDQANVFDQLYRSTDSTLQPYVSTTRQTTARLNAPSLELSKILGHSLIVAWEASEFYTIKSISGYRKVTWLDKLDLDGTPNDVAHSERHTKYDQLSQDLNVSGRWNAFHYNAGGYYFRDNGYTVNPIYVEISGAPVDFDSQYGTHTRAWAAYGQGDWKPLDPLTVTAGARYTSENKTLDRIFGFRACKSNDTVCQSTVPYTYYMPSGSGQTSPGVYRPPGATFTATSPMASVAWRFTDWLNTYLRYAEGFKSGGFNGEYSNIQANPATATQEHEKETSTPFRPEKQKSYEAGIKTAFLGGKALVNVAAFYNKLTDLQASIFTASGAAASIVRNAGKATVQGLEIETAWMPFEGTQIRANYAYLKPKYDVFNDAVCTGPNGTNCTDQNVADNRAFVHAPKSAYNLVADSELWGTRWGALHATADYAYTASFYTYPYQLRTVDSSKQTAGNTQVPAFGILNARLSFTGIPLGATRLGEVALWGRNVLDDDSPVNFIDFGPSFNNLTSANFNEPASFGLTGTVRW